MITGAFLFARNHDRSYKGLKGLIFVTALANSDVIITDSLMAGLSALNLERASHV
jgi:hypothetical protein